MVWALILALALVTPAYAEDIEVISEPEQIEVVTQEEVKEDAQEEKAVEPVADEGLEQVKEEPVIEKVEEGSKERALEVDSTEVGSPLGTTRATLNLTAYGNVSPTNQYAIYSVGLLKEVPYENGHYVFLQDTAQSYCMVVGKGDSILNLSDCKWWRWYNAGVNVGWVLERGTGSVAVTEGRYTVISDFEGYPALQDNSLEVLRREVMFYALVAVAAHVLCSVWSFVLRYSHSGIR